MSYQFQKLTGVDEISKSNFNEAKVLITNKNTEDNTVELKQVSVSDVGTVVEAITGTPSATATGIQGIKIDSTEYKLSNVEALTDIPEVETELKALKINDTSYKISNVEASTEAPTTENKLKGLNVNGVDYKIASGLPETATAGTALIYNGSEWTNQTGYGYETISGAVWDGDTTGKTACGEYHYKVSDTYVSATDIVGYTLGTMFDGTYSSKTITADDVITEEGGWRIVGSLSNENAALLLVLASDGTLEWDGTTLAKGLWLYRRNANRYVKNVSKTTYVKIDSKYIPDAPTITITESQISDVESDFQFTITFTDAQKIILENNSFENIYAIFEPMGNMKFFMRRHMVSSDGNSITFATIVGEMGTFICYYDKEDGKGTTDLYRTIPVAYSEGYSFIYGKDGELTTTPGYAYATEESHYWSGDTENRDSISATGLGTTYKVSTETPSIKDLTDGTVTSASPWTEYSITSIVTANTMGTVTSGDGSKLLVMSANGDICGLVALEAQTLVIDSLTINVPSTGIYLGYTSSNAYWARIEYTAISQFDSKYIPVSVSSTGTATDEVNYITIGNVEKKIGGGASYTAGTNIQISDNNVISATDTTYTAGTGIEITNNEISVASSITTDITNIKEQISTVKLRKMTQAEYDALATKDENTLYLIVG